MVYKLKYRFIYYQDVLKIVYENLKQETLNYSQ